MGRGTNNTEQKSPNVSDSEHDTRKIDASLAFPSADAFEPRPRSSRYRVRPTEDTDFFCVRCGYAFSVSLMRRLASALRPVRLGAATLRARPTATSLV